MPTHTNSHRFTPIKFSSIRLGSIIIWTLIAILAAYYLYPQDFPSISNGSISWPTFSLSNVTNEISNIETEVKTLIKTNTNTSILINNSSTPTSWYSSLFSNYTDKIKSEFGKIETEIDTIENRVNIKLVSLVESIKSKLFTNSTMMSNVGSYFSNFTNKIETELSTIQTETSLAIKSITSKIFGSDNNSSTLLSNNLLMSFGNSNSTVA